MTLEEFIKRFDQDHSIVLLEGKRLVKEEDREKLVTLGRILASNTDKMLFRSGNAEGADQLFAEGVAQVNPSRLQVITPYSGHRQKSNKAYQTITLDEIDLVEEPEVVYQSKSNKKTKDLIDRYVSGQRDRFSIKAAYIIRDTIKAIGTVELPPANIGLFYDDLSNPRSGGTGHTMNVCEQNKILVLDQRIWMEWLD